MTTKLVALVVEAGTAEREHLKAALRSSGGVSETHYARSSTEALQQLEAADRIDLIFLSSRLGEGEAPAIIRAALRSRAGRDAACIALLRSQPEIAELTAELLDGFDGVIVAPFSVDAVTKSLEIATRVRKERSDRRLRLALNLLITEIRSQLSQVSRLLTRGSRASISLAALREMCDVLRELSAEGEQLYFDTLIAAFDPTQNGATFKAGIPSYRGVSERVRAKTSRKALERLRQTLAA